MAVGINILSKFDSKGIDRAVRDFEKLKTGGEKAGFALKQAFVPALAVLGGLAAGLGFATKAAVEDVAAQEQLAGVLARSAGATDVMVASNEAFILSLSRATAMADDVLRPALASLVTATGDLKLSQDLLVQAQDISVSTGADLATTVDALSKAYNGNLRGLRALDPSLIDNIKSGASFDEIMKSLAETTGGAATDAANTAAGKMAGLKIAMDETKESIGMALLPVLDALVKILEPLARWAQDNSTLFLVLVGVVGGLAAAVVVANIALKVHAATTGLVTAATWLWNAALAANPIGLVVAGVALLTAGLVLLEIKTGLISAAFDRFGVAIMVVFGPLGVLIGMLKNAIDLKDHLSKQMSSIPGAGLLGDLIGKIPGFATGGIVTRPTLAMVGEAGPEAIIPLSKMGRVGGGSNGQVINVTVNAGIGTNGVEAGRQIIEVLQQYSYINPMSVQNLLAS